MQFYCIGGGGGCPFFLLPPFASRSATHLLRIELIRLLIVACGMLVHTSTLAVQRCWILEGTGTRCRICWSRASQTCSMGDISGEYAGHSRTGMFTASRNSVQILATWGRALSCCNMRWWPKMAPSMAAMLQAPRKLFSFSNVFFFFFFFFTC